MRTSDVLLVLILFALLALWAHVSRLAGLVEKLLQTQASQLKNQFAEGEQRKRIQKRERDSRARVQWINACPLCVGQKVYYGRACVYCLGYGEARRSPEAESRFREWASEVRQKWTREFGMPYPSAPGGETQTHSGVSS